MVSSGTVAALTAEFMVLMVQGNGCVLVNGRRWAMKYMGDSGGGLFLLLPPARGALATPETPWVLVDLRSKPKSVDRYALSGYRHARSVTMAAEEMARMA